MPGGTPWPGIAVVTPSFNQGKFIEETIRSVLLQGYPKLEYIIVDGGSTDESIEVIRRYSPWLSHWVSEPDRGQADAINKGLLMATAGVFNFINSDDLLTMGALAAVGEGIQTADVFAGACQNFSESGDTRLLVNSHLTADRLLRRVQETVYHQPAVWLRREEVVDAGGFWPELHYKFDRELTIRYLAEHPSVRYTSKTLARFREHYASKTTAKRAEFKKDNIAMFRRLSDKLQDEDLRAAASRELCLIEWRRTLDGEGLGANGGFQERLRLALPMVVSQPSLLWSAPTVRKARRLIARMMS
jgi:glycosyltransferase involved in cell wall biosynthesis